MALKPTAEPKGGQMGLLLNGSMSLDDRDRYIIQMVLKQNQYNVTMAARCWGRPGKCCVTGLTSVDYGRKLTRGGNNQPCMGWFTDSHPSINLEEIL